MNFDTRGYRTELREVHSPSFKGLDSLLHIRETRYILYSPTCTPFSVPRSSTDIDIDGRSMIVIDLGRDITLYL